MFSASMGVGREFLWKRRWDFASFGKLRNIVSVFDWVDPKLRLWRQGVSYIPFTTAIDSHYKYIDHVT